MKKLFWVALAVGVMGSAAGCTLDNTYASCSSDASCDGLDQCYAVTVGPAGTSGQFCSRTCTGDSDCESNFGYSGACYSVEGTPQLCYQRCTTDGDCYGSSVCIELTLTTGGLDYICVPDN